MTKVEGGTYKLSKKQEITVSDFYIGKYEVSIELWEIVTGQKCENLPQYAKNREVDHKREE
jgi:formylglycine-generating enzyme required for sulfatase activity